MNLKNLNLSTKEESKKPSKFKIYLVVISLIATIYSLICGLIQGVPYFQQIYTYLPLVFNDNYIPSQEHILLAFNLSLFLNSTMSNTNDSTHRVLLYNSSTMENCRIYNEQLRLIWVDPDVTSFTEIQQYQYTLTPLTVGKSYYFQAQIGIEICLFVISGIIYSYKIIEDAILLRRKMSKSKGFTLKKRNVKKKSKIIRFVETIKRFMMIFILDVGFLNIYCTTLLDCVTNYPPAYDLLRWIFTGFQDNLSTKGEHNYNLINGSVQLRINAVASIVIIFIIIKIILTIGDFMQRLCNSKDNYMQSNSCLTRCGKFILELSIVMMWFIIFLVCLSWRIFYIDWGNITSYNAVSLSFKEFAQFIRLIATIF